MNLKIIIAMSALGLPCLAEDTPAPNQNAVPRKLPTSLNFSPGTIEKVELLIEAKARLEEAEESLRGDGVEPIEMEGGMVLALPSSEEGRLELLKDLETIKGLKGLEASAPGEIVDSSGNARTEIRRWLDDREERNGLGNVKARDPGEITEGYLQSALSQMRAENIALTAENTHLRSEGRKIEIKNNRLTVDLATATDHINWLTGILKKLKPELFVEAETPNPDSK